MTEALQASKIRIKDLLAQGNVIACSQVCKAALEVHPNSLAIMERLVSCLDTIGKHEEALTWAEKAAGKRIFRAKKNRVEQNTRVLGVEGRIMASGYFYSGSGALVDFLTGFDDTIKWTPGGEMRLIKAPGGLLSFSKTAFSGNETEALLNLYLTIIGNKNSKAPTWKSSNRNSRKLLADPKSAGYVIEALQFWMKQKQRPAETPKKFASQSSEFLHQAFDQAATGHGADRLVIDQAINAWRLHLAKFAPPSTFLVVDRDPRDHFVEARDGWTKLGKDRLTVEGYVETFESIREKTHKKAKDLTHIGHKFLFYQFEDFVFNHEKCAQKLQTELKIPGKSTAYNPELSKQNIGKFKAILTKKERSYIEDKLKKHLHPAAT